MMVMSLVFNSCYKDALWLDLGRLFIGFGIGIMTYVVRSEMLTFHIELMI